MADLGFRRATEEPAIVYKVLRRLEEDRLVRSSWELAASGPARRRYELTDLGRAELHERAQDLLTHQRRIQHFMREYSSLAAEGKLAPLGESARPPRAAAGRLRAGSR